MEVDTLMFSIPIWCIGEKKKELYKLALISGCYATIHRHPSSEAGSLANTHLTHTRYGRRHRKVSNIGKISIVV